MVESTIFVRGEGVSHYMGEILHYSTPRKLNNFSNKTLLTRRQRTNYLSKVDKKYNNENKVRYLRRKDKTAEEYKFYGFLKVGALEGDVSYDLVANE